MLISLLFNTLALLLIAYILPGFRIKNFGSALLLALVLGLVNAFIRPVVAFISIPVNILTLGLFTFVINAAMLKIAAAFVGGAKVDGWGTAVVAAVLLSLISGLLGWML